ncbi:hypothetical protein [Aeromicrobium sp. Root472D3]|uniref:hypothetical protein n=1 Tax=Aeromicrobium sp. Root472D3 TaxID=1736540 RepID=UPI000B0CD0ED|nr:hypothetical protein [Aeromicrobium sp. Root472D3]
MQLPIAFGFTASFLIAVNVVFLTLATPHGVSNGVMVASLGLLVIGVMLAFSAFVVWLVEYGKSR